MKGALILAATAAIGCAASPALSSRISPRTAVMTAIATASAAPLADPAAPIGAPAVPAGWARGELAPFGRSSAVASLLLGPERPTTTPEVLHPEALPALAEAPRPTFDQRPGSAILEPGELSREIFVAPGCSRASVRNHAFGFIEVGGFSQPIAAQSGGGVELWHVKGGDGHDRYTFAMWQTLERGPEGALRLAETDAWFDMLTCKTYVSRRMEALAQPIAGGLAYVFRTRCADCKPGEQEKLHVLLPDLAWETSAFHHHEISLGRGTSSTFTAELRAGSIRRFRDGGAATARAVDTILQLDVVQAMGEAEPTAIVSVTDAPPSQF